MGCSCGYVEKNTENVVLKENIIKPKEIEVIERDDDQALPQMDAECEKCKNTKAYYWLQQTRAGDEPETKFLKCTKCKHVWRDYS